MSADKKFTAKALTVEPPKFTISAMIETNGDVFRYSSSEFRIEICPFAL